MQNNGRGGFSKILNAIYAFASTNEYIACQLKQHLCAVRAQSQLIFMYLICCKCRYRGAFSNYKIITKRNELVLGCRGSGHWSEATQAISHFLINLRFQLCVCCAAKCLTVAASSCCVRNLESFALRTRESLASESIFILCASSRGIYIVALACFVHLAFQVQVYYRRRCNEMAARACEFAPGVGSTNERPVSSRQINLL